VTVLSPPGPRQDELELLIREARARQRKRWIGGAAVVAVLAGAAIGLAAILSGRSTTTSLSRGGPTSAVKSGSACGVRVKGKRVLDAGGRTLYAEPGDWTQPASIPSQVRCIGSIVWVVWDNGAATGHEAFVGARSLDSGRTWKLVLGNLFFPGVDAPHGLGGSYLGPWTLRGRVAYFTAWCAACSKGMLSGTISLWVTRDEGRTFRDYKIPAFLGYEPTGVRVDGRSVQVSGKGFVRGVWGRKTVTVHTG
jgi:hypothetical protein